MEGEEKRKGYVDERKKKGEEKRGGKGSERGEGEGRETGGTSAASNFTEALQTCTGPTNLLTNLTSSAELITNVKFI